MANRNSTEATKAIQQAATQLARIDFDLLNQEMALHVSPLIEAVVNMLMIVYYQAGTGHATKHDFVAAKAGLQQSLEMH